MTRLSDLPTAERNAALIARDRARRAAFEQSRSRPLCRFHFAALAGVLRRVLWRKRP